MNERRFKAQVTFDITVNDMTPEGLAAYLAKGSNRTAEYDAFSTDHWQLQRRLLHAAVSDERVLKRLVAFALWSALEAGDYVNDEAFNLEPEGDYFELFKPILGGMSPEDAEVLTYYEEKGQFLEATEEALDSVSVAVTGVVLEGED